MPSVAPRFTPLSPGLRAVALALVIGLAVIGAPMAAQGGEFGYVIDDANDARVGFGPKWDLQRVEVAVYDDILSVAISTQSEEYDLPDPNLPDLGGVNVFAPRIDLDTDLNAATGDRSTATDFFGAPNVLGVDYFVDFLSYDPVSGTVLVKNDLAQTTGEAEVFFGSFLSGIAGQFMFVEIPLQALGNDDGRVHVSVVSGDRFEYADVAPNDSFIVSRLQSEVLVRGGRFLVTLDWKSQLGTEGAALPVFTSEDSTLLQFFSRDNWEMVVKVLDGCPINGFFWVYFGGPTDVEFTLTVTDLLTGVSKDYFNPLGTAAPAVRDIGAFPTCGGQI